MSFLNCTRGNVAYIFALLLPSFVFASGAAVEYNRAVTLKGRLQQSADSAALALAQGQLLEEKFTEDQAKDFLRATLSKEHDFTITTLSVEQPKSGSAIVTVDATVPTGFLSFFGLETLEINVVSESGYDEPKDLEFTVFIDRSPSMLIGATPADMDKIKIINEEMGEGPNCAFACHYTGRDSYTLTRTRGGATRLDAAKDATALLLNKALESDYADFATIYAEVRIFDEDVSIITDGTASQALTDLVNIVPQTEADMSGNKYAQTDFSKSMADLLQVGKQKAQTNTDRLNYAVLITDGVADYSWNGRKIEKFNPEKCNMIKNSDLKLAVIYTTYFPLYENNFYNVHVKPFENEIMPALKECASEGLFFEAEHAEDIDAAMQDILERALPRPVLKK
ncbi:MAG: pilus assembly protein TadG-related protein [Neomegalonema sp.]|nr:pilus assembly protein TadG-related protein [Neomegalonema sp.]